MMVYTLEDLSIIDFKVDHKDVFKNAELELNSSTIGINADLEDALKASIPIYFKNYSYGGISSIDFRGCGAERTKVYWNGIPINSPTLGSFDFSLLPSFLISEAKVRYGGASLVDGGGGIGGSVQLNQNNSFSKSKIEALASAGSFGNFSGAIKGQFVINKWRSDTRIFYHQGVNDFSFKNTYKQGHPEEKRNNNELWRFALQQGLAYTINESNSLDLNILYSKLERNIPSSISSTNDGSFQSDQLFFGQIAYNLLLKKDMFLKLRSSFQNQLNGFDQGYIKANNKVYAWNNNIDWGIELSDKFRLNASFRYDLYDVETYGTGYIREQQYSAFAAMDWNIIKSFELSLGVRLEGLDSQLSPSMPYIGLVWNLPKNFGSLKGSVSRVFRYATINERYWVPGGNIDLKPEEGWNYEASYNYAIIKEKTSFDFLFTAYYGIVNDWIQWYPSSDFSSVWQAQNLWKVKNSGLEFKTSFQWRMSKSSKLDVRFFYTYNNSHVVDDDGEGSSEQKQLILVPINMVFVPITYSFKQLSFSINYNYTGKRYTDNRNENYLAPYTLVDLGINYTIFKNKIDVAFRLNNILDQSYETYPGQPLPGINFNLQLRWQIL